VKKITRESGWWGFGGTSIEGGTEGSKRWWPSRRCGRKKRIGRGGGSEGSEVTPLGRSRSTRKESGVTGGHTELGALVEKKRKGKKKNMFGVVTRSMETAKT